MNIDVDGTAVIVRGARESAVYCANDDGWLYLAGMVRGTRWEAWVMGASAKGVASTPEQAAREVGRFFLAHRGDPPPQRNEYTRPMWQTETGPSQPTDGYVVPRLRDEDFRLVREWGNRTAQHATIG